MSKIKMIIKLIIKSIINSVKWLIKILISFIYFRPKQILYLLQHKELYNHISYYPEMSLRKSKLRIFFEQIREILKYGDINIYYFPYGFDIKNKEQKREYLHYSVFRDRRHFLNLSSPYNCSCILRDKILFNIFANGIGLKTAKNLFYITNDNIFEVDKKKNLTIDELLYIEECDLFCKLVDGECGNGIFRLHISKGRALIDSKEVTKEDLHNVFSRGRYIAQEIIRQHRDMARLHASSINSIRLITVRGLKDGKIYVLPSILRIGVKDNIVDNTSQGGIAIGFDKETGLLKEYGFYKPQFGLKTNVHPDSGIIFKYFNIPHIKEAIRDAIYFHSMLPNMHSVGWDIAIGKSGPIFIEGNDNWEINGPQICNGGLKEEFHELFYK